MSKDASDSEYFSRMDVATLRGVLAADWETNLRELRAALARDARYSIALANWHDEEIVGLAANLIESGTLTLQLEPLGHAVRFFWFHEADYRSKSAAGSSAKRAEKPEVASAPTAEKPKSSASQQPITHWIEFQVADEGTGKPLAGVKLVVKLADGSERRVESDRAGQVRLDDVPDGAFDVVEIQSEKTYEVANLN